MIKWIFFDMGSTLIDESDCYRIRNLETTADSDVTPEQFDEIQKFYARQNKYYYYCSCSEFSLPHKKWHVELGKMHPYTYETLASFYGKYHLGILANQLPGTKERLKEWDILKFFEVIASSDEIGIDKPETGLFFAAVEMAGCEPEEAVMIGDRRDNDVMPAQKIGMKTNWVRQGYGGYGDPKLLDKMTDLTVDTVEELKGKDLRNL